MKKLNLIAVTFLGMATHLAAQSVKNTYRRDLPEVLMGANLSLHFVSPEPIRYVDISSRGIAGDLPVDNVLRIKVIPDSLKRMMSTDANTVVTIVGESFLAQYRLRLAAGESSGICTQVEIAQQEMSPVDISGVSMTTPELKSKALAIISMRPSRTVCQTQSYGIGMQLNHLYTVGDLLFVDLTFHNKTKSLFDTEQLRFKIEDRRITKATNVQSVEITPQWQLYPLTSFQQTQRNIYVLKKISFPENKLLNIELSEKQISGRNVSLKIKYTDVLHADTF
jgi:conjugative transposon TraN protein